MTNNPTDTGPQTTRSLIIETCRDIAKDPSNPAAARVQAARTLAEMTGMLGKVQTGALDTGETREAEMSPDDIDRELARLARSTKAKS